MVDKENPSSESSPEPDGPIEAIYLPDSSAADEKHPDVDTSSDIVTAILVDDAPPIPAKFNPQNLAARGCLVASVVLGAWSIIGAWITAYSVINAMLGLALGFWGLSSNVRWPWLGVALSMAGILVCTIAAAAG